MRAFDDIRYGYPHTFYGHRSNYRTRGGWDKRACFSEIPAHIIPIKDTLCSRICSIETPEGTSIGLRKNLALMCEITQDDASEDKIKKVLESNGLMLK